MEISLTYTIDPFTNVRQRTFELFGYTYRITWTPGSDEDSYSFIGSSPDFLAQLTQNYPDIPEEELEDVADLMDSASDESDLVEIFNLLSQYVL